MKRLICFLLWTVTTSCATAQGAEAELDQVVQMRIRQTAPNVYPWLEWGKSFGGLLPKSRFEDQHIAFFTPPAEARLLLLQGNLPLMDEMLRKSFGHEAGPDRSFFDSLLPHFFLYSVADSGAQIMNARYLAGYRRMLAADVPEKFRTSSADLQKIAALCDGVRVEIAEDSWRLTMTVDTARGGAQRWTVAGKLRPFCLEEFQICILLPNGSFKPLR